MTWNRHSENNAPLTWIGNFPIYLSTVFASIHAGTMALTAIALACGAEAILQGLVFSFQSISRNFALWQIGTYAFVHFPPYWFFLLELYLLVVFGQEIERQLGRIGFLKLYLLLLVIAPIALIISGFLGFSAIYSGSGALHFGIFVAFATLCPTAEIFFNLQARWVALGLFLVNALQCLALTDFLSLGVLVLDCVAAYAIIQASRGQFQFPTIIPKRSPRDKIEYLSSMDNRDLHKCIDPILDKISRSGMASLTARERQQLEKARAAFEAQQKPR